MFMNNTTILVVANDQHDNHWIFNESFLINCELYVEDWIVFLSFFFFFHKMIIFKNLAEATSYKFILIELFLL